MICLSCRHRDHQSCPGGTWCDCQHEPMSALPQRAGGEEPLNWVRQG